MDCGESDEFNASDASNKRTEILDENINNGGLKLSKEQVSCFLTAPEIFTIRENLFKNKSKEDLELYKGHKFYFPSDCTASEEIVEDIMADNKKSLELQRITKNKDCLKAQWNDQEKIAILPHLKGKTTQHMGVTANGKCLLSPEEALFLLEKGVIEVEHNKMPLSVEEAYSVMLKGKLAVEKYEVYTHLSQQGFIVVHHSRIGSSYLKVMNLSKKKKRKRKAEGPAELPEQKRLTFSGVFPSNSVKVENNFSRDCLLSNDASVSNDKFISSDTLKRNENVSNANDKMELDLTNNDISSNFGEVDSHVSLDRETISNNDIVSSNFTEIDSHPSLEKEINMSCSKEKINQGDYVKELDVSGKDGESSAIFSNLCMKDKNKIDQVFEKGIETDGNVDAFEKDAESSITFSNVCMKDKNKIDQIFEKGSEADNNEMEINEVNVCMKDKQNKVDQAFETFSNVSMKDKVKIGQAFEKVSETDNHVDAFEKDGESSVTFSNLCMKDKSKIDQVFEKENRADNNEMEINEVNICMIDKQNKIDQIFEKEREIDDNEIEINEVNDNENRYNIKENIIDVESVNDNEIDVENINEESVRSNNDGDTNEVIIEDEKSDINVEDLGSGLGDDNEEYESTDESIPVVCEDSSEGSLDVYSCSPTEHQNDKDLSIETENVISKPSKIQDEEVTLVRVMKKEKKPLAVIDLLSDEEDNGAFRIHKSGSNVQSETNGKNMFEDSDEEIQVLDEVAGTASNKELSHRSVSAIKLESGKLKTESPNVPTQFKPQMKYPDTFRKDMICISRPFINLLPLHCLPAKEAYVLYTEKSSQPRSSQPRSNRLWNSYKDLQEYQRQRREKQRESKRNYFASRSSGPFRDQNDTFSNQISPFSTPEYSRDFGNDRNHNYPAPPSRSFYQPVNSERGGGGLLPTPGNFNSPNQLPFSMNVHNLQNLSTTNPTAFINEFQKNVYSVATNMISTMLNQHLNPINSQPAYPPAFNNSNFMNFNPHPNNNFSVPPATPDPMAYNSSDRNDFQPVRFPPEPSFFGERHPASMNEGPFMMENNWKQANNFPQRNFTPRGPSFPCKYRAVRRKRNWNDVKAAVEGANVSDSGSDIEEVPINLNRFLYSNDIKPLIDPGKKLPVADCLKALKITQTANLCDINKNIDRYLPATLTVEISFDVYLPNTKYRRSEPGVPNYRIIVVRASDPIPRYSELVNLQRKWNDGSVLQVAVVDHGDVSFYSFNGVNIQELVPFDSLHG